ncbi:MAG: M10 family metallopeptidase C-terminal domain-containing protein [Paracoccaceae bacterium]|nr:MAG: M10 family metallopeptidase C-terminal domain-containing protein [Paracoccaceae bacterium]
MNAFVARKADPTLVDGFEPRLRQAELVELADAAGSTMTAYTIAVGDRLDGTITPGDEDWIGINLVAGQSYVFTVFGRGGGQVGLEDSVLRVMSPSGLQLAYNDDIEAGSQNFFSGITFTATTTGRHYIAVSGWPYEAGNGQYTVQTATNVYTVDQVVSQLTEFNWGISAPLRIIPAAGGAISVNISGLDAAGRRLADWALEAWTYATGLTFSITTSGTAQIVIDDNAAGAFAGPDLYDPATGIVSLASVNVSKNWLASYGAQFNSYSFVTYIHEIGHALGLGHMGPYDGSASYSSDAFFLNDSYQMSVMSYFSAEENTYIGGTGWLPVTPMIGDMAAIASVYGAAGPVHAGNTVWGTGSNVGGYLGRIMGYMFDGATNATEWLPASDVNAYPIGLTIRDTGGTDLLDLSNHTSDQRIDLTPGAASDVGGERGNVVIMSGTIIENLRSGSGNDHLTGNSADNEITPGRGNDTVYGGAGNDTVVINATRAATTVTAIEGGYRLVSADGTDLVYGVEFVRFTDQTVASGALLGNGAIEGGPGADSRTGTTGPDLIFGYGGNDVLRGGDGHDTLYGGADHDVVSGQQGNDVLYGDAGDDTIAGSTGDDEAYGGIGNDQIGGGEGNDSLFGGAGDDIMGGGPGNDLMDGGDGRDYVSGGIGDDLLRGGAGHDTIASSYGNDMAYGDAGNDAIGGGYGYDTLYGGDGNDTIGGGDQDDLIFGGADHDMLSGGNGNDTIFGGSGNDTINAGLGSDWMTGDEGADVFVFNLRLLVGPELDVITDFVPGEDRINLSFGVPAPAETKFASLAISAHALGTQIVRGDQTIILQAVQPTEIGVDDFMF